MTGRGIELLLARYDPENEDAMAYLEERLARIGVLRALEEEGFRAGDELEIAGVPFDLDQADETRAGGRRTMRRWHGVAGR